jgi:hypothetical protein
MAFVDIQGSSSGLSDAQLKLIIVPSILPDLDAISEDILDFKPEFNFVAPEGVGIPVPEAPPPFARLDPNEQRARLRAAAKALNTLATAVQARADKRSNLTIKLDPSVDAEAIQAIRRKYPDADPTKITYDQYKECRDNIRKLGERNGRKPLNEAKLGQPNFGIGSDAARDGTLLRPELNPNAQIITPLNIFDYQDFVVRILANFIWKFFIKPSFSPVLGPLYLLLPDVIVPLKPDGLAESIFGLGGHILGMG